MPKFTRDAQFQLSFANFMNSFTETYYPDLKDWKIVNTVENKGSSYHHYKLTIPKKVVLCEIDRTVEENINVPSVEIMTTDQELPTIELLQREFKEYYDQYQIEEHGRVVSYTSICMLFYEPDTSEVASEDTSLITTQVNSPIKNLTASIEVCYYKSYLPYPSDVQTREQLLEQCKQMRIANVNLKYDLDHMFHAFQMKSRKLYHTRKLLRRQEANANDKLSNTIYRMQEKIRELYHRLGDEALEECPVCYEVMRSNEIVVPGCCHYICAACNEACDKCPLCREEYVV
jgi:hypothetical protein